MTRGYRASDPRIAPETSLLMAVVDGGAEVPVQSPYFTRYWLPSVGPSVVALLRFVNDSNGQHYTGAELATALGLGSSCATLSRTLGRARGLGWIDVNESRLSAVDSVPPLRARHIGRLPEPLRRELARG